MYITVLDFTAGRVLQYRAGSGALSSEDYEAFLEKKGHSLGNIEWMLHDDPEVITD